MQHILVDFLHVAGSEPLAPSLGPNIRFAVDAHLAELEQREWAQGAVVVV